MQSDRSQQLTAALTLFSAAQPQPVSAHDCKHAGRQLLQLLQQQFGAHDTNNVQVVMRRLLQEMIDVSNAITIIKAVNQALAVVIPNIHTRDKFFTELRKQIRTTRTEQEWQQLQCLVIVDRQVRRAKQLHTQRQVAAKNHNVKSWDFSALTTAMQQLQQHCNDDIAAQTVLVLMCTGSRLIEVLRVTTFTTLTDQPQHIQVHELAKRGSNRTVQRPVWFLTPPVIVQMVRRIQQHVQSECQRLGYACDDDLNKRITNTFDPIINAKLQQHLPGATTRNCRDIYVNITRQLHAPERESIVRWAATVLGHQDGMLHAATHYTGCNVKGVTQTAPAMPTPALPAPSINASSSTGNSVQLTSKTGELVQLQRQPHRRDGKSQLHLQHYISLLEAAGVAASRTHLKRVGFGESTITTYRRKRQRVS